MQKELAVLGCGLLLLVWAAILLALRLTVPSLSTVYLYASLGLVALVAVSLGWRRLRRSHRRAQQSSPDPSADWWLRHAFEADVFDPDELFVEIEAAAHGSSPGALVVTDKRLVFTTTSLLRRRTKVIAVALPDISNVKASQRGEMGELTVTATDLPSPRTIEIYRLSGGIARANELADSIRREQTRHQQRSGASLVAGELPR